MKNLDNIIEEFYTLKVGTLQTKRKSFMNSVSNITLMTVGTGLVATGAASIGADLKVGLIEIVLGIICYAVYELVPTKTV